MRRENQWRKRGRAQEVLKSRRSGYCLRKMKEKGRSKMAQKTYEAKKQQQQQQHQIDKGKCVYNGIGTI